MQKVPWWALLPVAVVTGISPVSHDWSNGLSVSREPGCVCVRVCVLAEQFMTSHGGSEKCPHVFSVLHGFSLPLALSLLLRKTHRCYFLLLLTLEQMVFVADMQVNRQGWREKGGQVWLGSNASEDLKSVG